MNIYDKASWHIDGGQDKDIVISRFEVVFSFLNNQNMLSEDGKEIYELGIDDSAVIHDGFLNADGKAYMDANYDSLLNLSLEELKNKLK